MKTDLDSFTEEPMKKALMTFAVALLSYSATLASSQYCNVLTPKEKLLYADEVNDQSTECFDLTVTGERANYLAKSKGYNLKAVGLSKCFRTGIYLEPSGVLNPQRGTYSQVIRSYDKIVYNLTFRRALRSSVDLGFNNLTEEKLPTCEQIRARLDQLKIRYKN